MKQYIFIASALLFAAVSCSKITPDNTVNEQEVEINFDAQNYVAQTKAEYSTSSKFGCYALYTGDTKWSDVGTSGKIGISDAAKLMDDVEISCVNSVWKNATQTYYWPKSGKLTFICYSPKAAALSLGSAKSSILSKSNYVVKATASEQTADGVDNDLMVAGIASDKTKSSNPVSIVFKHALSLVCFQAKASSLSDNNVTYHVVLNSVGLKDILNTGTLTYDVSGSTPATKWSDQSNKVSSGAISSVTNAENSVGSEYKAPSAELSTSATDQGKAYYAMPQTLADASVIEVKYTIYACNSDKKVLSISQESATVTLNTLGSTAITSWEANKKYTYTLTISPVSTTDPITFSPSVDAWDTASAEKTL